MKASEVRQNAIDASLEEIEKIEAEIVKASNGGNGNIRINVPYDKHRAILAYFRDNGFEVRAFGQGDVVDLIISWF